MVTSTSFYMNFRTNLGTIIPPPLLLLLPLLMIFLRKIIIKYKPREVYLVDFACYKPNEAQKIPTPLFLNILRTYYPNIKEESLQLMEKIARRSGLGQSTHVSTGIMMQPPSVDLAAAKEEAEEAVFGAVGRLLEKTGVKAEEVGILVVNCSLFNPLPSLCSMVVNRYKMKDDVKCYNLSGMGCSAGLASIHMANDLLQVHKNAYALVVSTENVTQNIYFGNDRSKLGTNCFFRVGGAAILLSNRDVDRDVAKYRLLTAVRTNTTKSDVSYKCIFQEEDSQGIRGVSAIKDLIVEASAVVKANLITLGPTILPVTEQLRYVINSLARKLHVAQSKTPYVPKFSHAVDHFITHVGGKPVIDSVERVLGFKASDMEASRMTLYRFGNTSSSSVWYGLGYEEAKGRVKKGHTAWQIAFGSGFKCVSVVWKAMKDVEGCEKVNPWMDEIDMFPVDLNKVSQGELSSTNTSNFFELL